MSGSRGFVKMTYGNLVLIVDQDRPFTANQFEALTAVAELLNELEPLFSGKPQLTVKSP